ncbi:MAG TPA: hypothetical protein VFX51_17230 [Solirubrobacteraceae bacterium]|nr:hypothetical protein [Solirubrobacteraceae bacterium]
MTARDSARTLELVIRGAMAEERLLGARLARMAESQRQTRSEIEREIRREHFGHPPPNGNGASPTSGG